MRSKRLSGNCLVLLIYTFLVLGVFGTSAVFAYHANFKLSMPLSFSVQNCTLKYGNELIFSSDATQTQLSENFVATPVAQDTLQIACKYSAISATFELSVTTGFTAELTKMITYGTVAYDQEDVNLDNNTFVEQTITDTVLTITLKPGITPQLTDDIVFNVKITKL